jgi:hypothetical protein
VRSSIAPTDPFSSFRFVSRPAPGAADRRSVDCESVVLRGSSGATTDALCGALSDTNHGGSKGGER